MEIEIDRPKVNRILFSNRPSIDMAAEIPSAYQLRTAYTTMKLEKSISNQ